MLRIFNAARAIRWLGLGLIALALSGCLRWDLAIQFDHQNHGQIRQHVVLQERTAALGGAALAAWIEQLERRTRALGGQVRTQGSELTLTVPFANGAELEERFNQLFAASLPPELGAEPLRSHLQLHQQNWLLAIHNHLIYDLDLTELPPALGPAGGVLPASDWLQLRLQLQTPGQLHILSGSEPLETDSWRLTAGDRHHIDVEFWVPSWIGIGAVAIATLVLAGYGAKYGRS